jgi:hypothetical protein
MRDGGPIAEPDRVGCCSEYGGGMWLHLLNARVTQMMLDLLPFLIPLAIACWPIAWAIWRIWEDHYRGRD